VTDAKGPGDIGMGIAGSYSRYSLPLLIAVQGRPSAQVDAPRLCPLPALAGAGLDQFPLKLRQGCQDGQDQSTVRRGGVGPNIRQTLTMIPARQSLTFGLKKTCPSWEILSLLPPVSGLSGLF
jgi:hypothetical protein